MLDKEQELVHYLYKRVLQDDPLMDSYMNTLGYSTYLGYPEFASFFVDLVRTSVLDAGSGYGGLAIDLSRFAFPVEIVSLNPRIILPGFSLQSLGEIEPDLKRYPETKLRQAVKVHNQTAVAAFAQFLPFQDGVFDRVFDCRGILMHAQKSEEIETAFQEFWRVLKPGGKLITAPFMNEDQKKWALEAIHSLNIHFTPIVYRQQIKDQGMLGGFRCYKPE